MKSNVYPALFLRISSLALFLSAAPLAAQNTLLMSDTGKRASVVSMDQAGDELGLTEGHSSLLLSDKPLGTIIIGDDTIALTTIGAGNSIILTGLTAGSTNLIVLSETQELLLAATVLVLPVPMAPTVRVNRGAALSERFECRQGLACVLIDPKADQTGLSLVVQPASSVPETESDSDATQKNSSG